MISLTVDIVGNVFVECTVLAHQTTSTDFRNAYDVEKLLQNAIFKNVSKGSQSSLPLLSRSTNNSAS